MDLGGAPPRLLLSYRFRRIFIGLDPEEREVGAVRLRRVGVERKFVDAAQEKEGEILILTRKELEHAGVAGAGTQVQIRPPRCDDPGVRHGQEEALWL